MNFLIFGERSLTNGIGNGPSILARFRTVSFGVVLSTSLVSGRKTVVGNFLGMFREHSLNRWRNHHRGRRGQLESESQKRTASQ